MAGEGAGLLNKPVILCRVTWFRFNDNRGCVHVYAKRRRLRAKFAMNYSLISDMCVSTSITIIFLRKESLAIIITERDRGLIFQKNRKRWQKSLIQIDILIVIFNIVQVNKLKKKDKFLDKIRMCKVVTRLADRYLTLELFPQVLLI